MRGNVGLGLLWFCIATVGCRSRSAAREPAAEAAAAAEVAEAPDAGPAVLPDEERTWSASAANDRTIEIRQTANNGARDCKLQALRAGEALWSLSACVATIGEMRLVSPDGEALLVVEESPRVEEYPTLTPVATLIRHGAVLRKLLAGDLEPTGRGIRVESGRLFWLSPARPPQIGPHEVVFTLANQQQAAVSWDGKKPALAVAAGQEHHLNCSGGCKYTDANGVLQFVTNEEDIPDEARAKAVEVHARVNTSDAKPLPQWQPGDLTSPERPQAAATPPMQSAWRPPGPEQERQIIYGLPNHVARALGAVGASSGPPAGTKPDVVTAQPPSTDQATPPNQ